MTTAQNTIVMLAKHWPLATPRQAKRQAVRLIRARDYLRSRNIEACAVKSAFEYSQGPKVLKCST